MACVKEYEFFTYLKEKDVHEDIVVFIKNIDDNTIDKVILFCEYGEGFWQYEWSYDWYEGQNFKILGYTIINNIEQMEVTL